MRNTSADKIKLGNKTLISDPCYEWDTWRTGKVNTLPGDYIVKEIAEMGKHPTLKGLFVVHSSQYEKLDYSDCNEDSLIEVGVDSGECGIYNSEKYPLGGIGFCSNPTENPEICRAPDGDWGVTAGNFGGVGSYKAYLHRNGDGKVDAIYLDFTMGGYGEYDDEEYDEEEEDWEEE